MIIRTDDEIQQAISKLNERRQDPALKKPANFNVRDGWREALRVLCDKDESLPHIADHVHNVQARCIAWLAVDWLQGNEELEVLLRVPLKTDKKDDKR